MQTTPPPRAPHVSLSSSQSNAPVPVIDSDRPAMSNILPTLESFAKVSSCGATLPGPSPHISSGNRRDRSRPVDCRCVPSLAFQSVLDIYDVMPLFFHPPRAVFRPAGFGLLFFGQNYLIYPSAFPPGSRTGVCFRLDACSWWWPTCAFASRRSRPDRFRPSL